MMAGTRKENFNGLIIDGVQTYEEDLVTQDLCVTGTVLLLEDLEAAHVEIPGNAHVRGLLTCDKINIEGQLECGYSFVVDEAEIGGRLKVCGKINAESLEVFGNVICRDSAKIYDLDVAGEFSCVGKLRCEKISVMGSLWVDGNVRAIKISINSGVKSYADELVADTFTVKKSALEVPEQEDLDYLFEGTLVDCDKANVNYSRIRSLYCRKATVGPGCVIDEIFCKQEVTVSPEATVGRVVYI